MIVPLNVDSESYFHFEEETIRLAEEFFSTVSAASISRAVTMRGNLEYVLAVLPEFGTHEFWKFCALITQYHVVRRITRRNTGEFYVTDELKKDVNLQMMGFRGMTDFSILNDNHLKFQLLAGTAVALNGGHDSQVLATMLGGMDMCRLDGANAINIKNDPLLKLLGDATMRESVSTNMAVFDVDLINWF